MELREKRNIKFFLPFKNIPSVTHQEKKISTRGKKPVVYEDERLKELRSKYMSMLWPHAPEVILEGPIELKTMWCYPEDKKRVKGTWKTTKPDTHNLVKLLVDCMTKVGFWKDDAEISREIIEKLYNDISGIYIEVTEL